MMKLLSLFFRPANIVGPLPNNIANGQVEDAVPVMANLNWIINQVNANAQQAGLAALVAAANSFTQLQSGIAATNPANFPIASQIQNVAFNTLSSTLGTNTLTSRVATMALSAYGTGQVFNFIPSQTNTGAVTMAIDGLNPTPVLAYGLPVGPGYLRQNVPTQIEHDGVNFNLLAMPQAQVQAGAVTSLSSTAGSQAITTRVTSLPLAAYGTGQFFTFIPASSNSAGGVTINVDSLGAKNLAANGSTALGLELVANVPAAIEFDGTKFNLLSRNPGWVLINKATAANSASIDFTNISATYDVYALVLNAIVPATNLGIPILRYSVDGGATFKAGAGDYQYSLQALLTSAAADNKVSTGDTGICLSGTTGISSTATNGGHNATVFMFNMNSTSQIKNVQSGGSYVNGTPVYESFVGGGITNLAALNNAAINAIRLIMSSGNITSGDAYLFGLRKA